MNYSKFYSSLLLLILLNAIIKPVWIFGIDRQVQNITGTIEYGTYFALLNLSIVFGGLLDWGLSSFVNRELAAKKMEIREQLGGFLLIKLVFAILYAGITASVAFISGVKRWDILEAVLIIQFLTFLFVFLRGIVTANQWFKTDAWLSVLDKLLMIIICSGFILAPGIFGPINIRKFLFAQIGCTITAVLVVFLILAFRGIVIRKPNLKFLKPTMILSALPFAITVLLMSIHTRLDGFLLERMHSNGAHEAGIYAAAYRLLDASNMIGYLIASFFMPFVARLWSEGKNLKEPVLQTRHVQLMFAVSISAITVMLAPWLQKILYHREDRYGVEILQWCLPALIGYGLVQVYGTVMTAMGSIISFCYLNAIALAMNLIINVLFIPKYGAFSCCVAALCSQLWLGISAMIFVHRKLKISTDLRSLVIYILNGGVIVGALYILSKTSFGTVLLLPLAFLITFLIMVLSKMIPLNSWLGLLKKQ